MITVVSLSEIPLTRGGAMPGQADAAPSARPTRLAMVRRASPLSSRGAEMAEKGAEINNAPANKQADLHIHVFAPNVPTASPHGKFAPLRSCFFGAKEISDSP